MGARGSGTVLGRRAATSLSVYDRGAKMARRLRAGRRDRDETDGPSEAGERPRTRRGRGRGSQPAGRVSADTARRFLFRLSRASAAVLLHTAHTYYSSYAAPPYPSPPESRRAPSTAAPPSPVRRRSQTAPTVQSQTQTADRDGETLTHPLSSSLRTPGSGSAGPAHSLRTGRSVQRESDSPHVA